MGFVGDVLLGSIAGGVNNATLFLINFSLVSCILLLGSLAVSGGVPPDVLPHLAVVAFFALGLLVSVNWVVRQTGTVSPEDQRKELFGDKEEKETAVVETKKAA